MSSHISLTLPPAAPWGWWGWGPTPLGVPAALLAPLTPDAIVATRCGFDPHPGLVPGGGFQVGQCHAVGVLEGVSLGLLGTGCRHVSTVLKLALAGAWDPLC